MNGSNSNTASMSCSNLTRRHGVLADKSGVNVAKDGAGDYVYLAPNRVNLTMTQERHPEVKFLETRELH